MDRLDALNMFIAAIDEGSLAKAGRKCGRSPAAVTRAVAGLEAAAGERLIHRSSRGLTLTAEGLRHLEAYRRIVDTWDELDGNSHAGSLRGTVVVTAPELFGRTNVVPIVEDFLAAHPDMQARVLLRNRVVDLVGEGINVAVRLAELEDSGLVAIRLGTMRRVVCASPEHVASKPSPERPVDLQRCSCIGVGGTGARELWPLAIHPNEPGRGRSITVPTRLTVDSAAAVLDCVRRGRGIGQFMAYQVAEDLRAGRLVRLLADYELEPTPVHIVFHDHARRHPRLRGFLDHAVERLRTTLATIDHMVG